MDPCLGVGIALDAHSLAGPFSGASVGGRALTADGEAAEVPHAAVTFDGLEAFQVESDFAAEIAFGGVFAFLDGVNDLGELLFVQVFGADLGIDGSAFEDDLGIGRANSVNVTEGDINAFVTGNINAEKSWHKVGAVNLVVVYGAGWSRARGSHPFYG